MSAHLQLSRQRPRIVLVGIQSPHPVLTEPVPEASTAQALRLGLDVVRRQQPLERARVGNEVAGILQRLLVGIRGRAVSTRWHDEVQRARSRYIRVARRPDCRSQSKRRSDSLGVRMPGGGYLQPWQRAAAQRVAHRRDRLLQLLLLPGLQLHPRLQQRPPVHLSCIRVLGQRGELAENEGRSANGMEEWNEECPHAPLGCCWVL